MGQFAKDVGGALKQPMPWMQHLIRDEKAVALGLLKPQHC